MSTTATFAGNLAEAPELRCSRGESKPFLSCRGSVNRRVQNDQGECVNEEPTAHSVKIFGSAATQVHNSYEFGDPIHLHGFVHCLEGTEGRPDKETGEKRVMDVVVIDHRVGEVGVSLKYLSTPIKRAARPGRATRVS